MLLHVHIYVENYLQIPVHLIIAVQSVLYGFSKIGEFLYLYRKTKQKQVMFNCKVV